MSPFESTVLEQEPRYTRHEFLSCVAMPSACNEISTGQDSDETDNPSSAPTSRIPKGLIRIL